MPDETKAAKEREKILKDFDSVNSRIKHVEDFGEHLRSKATKSLKKYLEQMDSKKVSTDDAHKRLEKESSKLSEIVGAFVHGSFESERVFKAEQKKCLSAFKASETSLDAMGSALKDLKTAVENVNDEVGELSKEVEHTKGDNQELTKEVDALNKRIDTFNGGRSRLGDDVAKIAKVPAAKFMGFQIMFKTIELQLKAASDQTDKVKQLLVERNKEHSLKKDKLGKDKKRVKSAKFKKKK